MITPKDVYMFFLKRMVVFVAVLSVSSCVLTSKLNSYVNHTEYSEKKYTTDDVLGLSLGVDNVGRKGWVFVGKNFDYFLTYGGDDIVAVLVSGKIDRHNLFLGLSLPDKTIFRIDPSGKSFEGSIDVTYNYVNGDKVSEVAAFLKEKGFVCGKANCVYSNKFIHGEIHKKSVNQDNSKVIMFYHPVSIGFYQINEKANPMRATSAVLYPFAVVGDIVSAPLQLILMARGIGGMNAS